MFNHGRAYGITLILLTLLPSSLSKVTSLEDGSHYTNFWVVELKHDLSERKVNELAQTFGFLNYGKVFPDSNIYEFHHPRVTKRSLEHSEHHTNLLDSHEHVTSAEQLIGKVRVKRAHIQEESLKVTDPRWPQTWYLNRGIRSNQYDMNVIPAWRKGFTGKNVVVTILDDGIERDHPDLINNYDPLASKDINGRDDDPMPRYDYTNENRHGTRCAGEVAAQANNTVCSVGVAHHAKIGGIRMLDGSVTDTVEASSLSHQPNHVDIYSASWGPDDNGRTVDGPGKLAKKAFVDGVEKGRNGKGNIFLWASGNGGSHHDSCACDGYTNSIYTLSVSSASEHNTPPWYLEECASTLATTYSSGASGREKQIVTTDLRKSCTTSHTGTSASAPLAAGLVAVMLEANPTLTWRDVQYLTMAAANPEPLLTSGKFKTNGVGRKYSHKFGYGLMDCGKMVDIALTWKEVPSQLKKALPISRPDSDLSSTYKGTIEVPPCNDADGGCINYLEHVQLVLHISSTRRGKLSVKVKSPHGTESIVLPQRLSDTVAAAFLEWPFLSVHFWGENPSGTWEFEVNNGGQTGKISSYQLVLYGVAVDPFDLERPEKVEIKCDESCANAEKSYLACFGSGPDQCKRCKDGLYKVVDTNLCVSSCVDGYFKDGVTCKRCFKTCQQCSGADEASCTSCTSNLLLDNEGHCVEQCPTGFYPDDVANLCKECLENCTSCNSLDDCLSCDPGFDDVNGECKKRCEDSEYRDETGVCVPCTDVHCARCNEAQACELCDSEYNLYKNSCLKVCPQNTFDKRSGRDGGQTECFDCHANCATCNEGMDNNCLSCHEQYQLSLSHKCVANATCPLGQFRALNVGDCELCHESCNTCSGSEGYDCTSCPNNRYLKDGACVSDCGDGLFQYINEHDKHASCQHCHPSCASCTGYEPDQCTSCPENSQLNLATCTPVCDPGHYLKNLSDEPDEGHNLPQPCANCSAECLTCSGPRIADCTSCVADKVLDQAGKCVKECGEGFFKKGLSMEGVTSNNICHSCNPKCLSCFGDLSSNCLTCPEELMLFEHQCVKKSSCYSKQYYNATANECFACHATCLDCTGPTEVDCTSCGEKQKLYITPPATTTAPAAMKPNKPQPSGQCILCCDDDHTIVPGICCDCTAAVPKCDEAEPTESTVQTPPLQAGDHKHLVTYVVISILGCVLIYVIVFLSLQYKSYGRCVWQSSSSTVLVDGRGLIEYSTLNDKDTDTLFAAEDGFRGPLKYTSESKEVFDYGSD